MLGLQRSAEAAGQQGWTLEDCVRSQTEVRVAFMEAWFSGEGDGHRSGTCWSTQRRQSLLRGAASDPGAGKACKTRQLVGRGWGGTATQTQSACFLHFSQTMVSLNPVVSLCYLLSALPDAVATE